MVEVLLSGIVIGLVPVTILGLFVAAYLQYRRGNQFYLILKIRQAIDLLYRL